MRSASTWWRGDRRNLMSSSSCGTYKGSSSKSSVGLCASVGMGGGTDEMASKIVRTERTTLSWMTLLQRMRSARNADGV